MSNSIAPGSSADVNVKVTALTANLNVPAQYKTIILKKNLVNGVNTLRQEMMSAANTKYVVKYDYVLGEDITIPANCVLDFDGGSINGAHMITGTKTSIKSVLNKIFDINVIFTGTWNNEFLSPQWFGAYNDGVHDDAAIIEHTLKVAQDITVSKILLTGKYGVSTLHIVGNQNGNVYTENIWYTLDGENNAQLISLDSTVDIICYGNSTTDEYCHIKTILKGFTIIANNNSKCVINGKLYNESDWPSTNGNIITKLLDIFVRDFVGIGIDCGAMTECDFYNIRLEANGGNDSIGIRIFRSVMNFYSTTILYCDKAIVCDKSAECSFIFIGGFFGICGKYVCFSKQHYMNEMCFISCNFAENGTGEPIYFIDDSSTPAYYGSDFGVSFINCVFGRIPEGSNDNYLMNITFPGLFNFFNCVYFDNPGSSNIIKTGTYSFVNFQGNSKFIVEDLRHVYDVFRRSKYTKIFSITDADTQNPHTHFNMTIPDGKWLIKGLTVYTIDGSVCNIPFQLVFNGSAYYPVSAYLTNADGTPFISTESYLASGGDTVTLITYGLQNMPKDTYFLAVELNMVNISDLT